MNNKIYSSNFEESYKYIHTIKNIDKLSEELFLSISNENLLCYVEQVHQYLLQNWWKFDNKLKNFYKKDNNITKDFRSLSKPKKQTIPTQIAELFINHNKQNNQFHSLDIINNFTDTDFTISWIQHIFSQNIEKNRVWFLHQPVIRLNGDSQWSFFISWNEWIWTSFVNTTKYNINSNTNNLIEWLEDFFDFLSSIWIFIGDISLTFKLKKDIRKQKEVYIFMIHIFYWNLNIWDTSLIQNFNNWIIQDLWFWLERLNMARNKNNNYFEQYLHNKELISRFSDKEIDSIKTISLLLTSSEKIFQKSGSRSTYIKLIKILEKNKNYYPLIKIFQKYWNSFWYNFDSNKLQNDIEIYCN